jgi:hypothetical protein
MTMKAFVASALVALGLLTTAVSAYADSPYHGYPDWARNAFETANQ